MTDSLNERFFSQLYLIRRVEEEVARIYPSDKIKVPVHLSIGQEAVAVGVCEALREGDIVFPTYRGHAAYIAKGGNLNAMIAELYGKATGCARGKGGSMHLIDPSAGVMGASAVVGTNIPLAVGAALTAKLRANQSVSVAFFGDGAIEEGVFHESMNFAAHRGLPVLFVCENNNYAIHTPRKLRQSEIPIHQLGAQYGMESHYVADGNVFAIHAAASGYVNRLRAGEGPFLLECSIYRWKEHVGPSEDFSTGYRSIEELDEWLPIDAVKVTGERLPDDVRSAIVADVENKVKEAFEFAESSPFPGPEELLTNVYSEAQWSGF